jgi:D-xylose 1-dehydrogenase (NADP+, D-xylono-1,5-lactone-forming)
MSDVRWGVLGAGKLVQKATGRAIHEATGAQLYATGARDLDRAQATGAVHAYGSYQAVIDDPDVDAVYICLSNEAHLPWIRAAITAGKHVLCEKPMVLTAAETESVFSAAENAGTLLVEATWSRWHPRMRRIVELATYGSLGEIESFTSTFTYEGVDPSNYRLSPAHGGGALYDIGIYPLHAMYACLPTINGVSIISVEHVRTDDGVDLTTRASLGCTAAAEANITASFIEPASQVLTIRGTEGEIRVEDELAFTSLRQPSDLWVDGHIESFPAVDAYQIMFEDVSAQNSGKGGWVLPAEDSMQSGSNRRCSPLID